MTMIATLRNHFLVILLLLAAVGMIYLSYGKWLTSLTERTVAQMRVGR